MPIVDYYEENADLQAKIKNLEKSIEDFKTLENDQNVAIKGLKAQIEDFEKIEKPKSQDLENQVFALLAKNKDFETQNDDFDKKIKVLEKEAQHASIISNENTEKNLEIQKLKNDILD